MLARCAVAAAIVATGCALAQQPQEIAGARELFYAGTAAKETLAPIRRVSAPVKEVAAPAAAVTPPAEAGARNLGLRYNLVLVNQQTGQGEAVSPDRNFTKGECFAIDLESNRSGYLYVLAKQSSGNWSPLFPSAEMTAENNVINPGQKVRVPARYCFEISDPPGTETLFVVLSRDPREVYELNEGIRRSETPAQPSPPEPRPGTFQVADARLVNNAVAHMSEQVYSRDLVIRKINQPVSARETAYSVYVVNASPAPASKVVTEIQVNHR